MLKIRFLGTSHVELGADSLTKDLSGREFALFAFLAVTGKPQNRNTLSDLLWDNQSEKQAKTNLRYLLRDLRKTLGDYLEVDKHNIRFNQHLPYWLDVATFTVRISPVPATNTSPMTPEILQEVLNLYGGEFLTGFHIQNASMFEHWMLAQRRHLQDLAIRGFQLSTQQHLLAGEYDIGLALNEYLLTLEPWREEAHRQRMLLLAASGQRSAALMQYEICCQTLVEELDVPPMEETTNLYTQIRSGQWFLAQPTAHQRHHPSVAVHAYPQSSTLTLNTEVTKTDPVLQRATEPLLDVGTMPDITRFYGRQKEIADLHTWIQEEKRRFVAIQGLGGQGKSSLAAYFVQEELAQMQEDNQQKETRFTHIIWRSVHQIPSCTELLQDWLRQIDGKSVEKLPANLDQLMTMLFEVLQQSRALLILDGVDAIIQYDADLYRPGYAAYATLFRLFVQRQHSSCLLLTSRQRIPEITQLDHQHHRCANMELPPLSAQESADLLNAYRFPISSAIAQELHIRYAGNPLMLNQMAEMVHELFDGNMDAFLQEQTFIFGNIGSALHQQLSQLSPLEWEMLRFLVHEEQSLDVQTLWSKLASSPPKSLYFTALHTLRRAFLLQQEGLQIKLKNLVAAYLTEYRPATVDPPHLETKQPHRDLASQSSMLPITFPQRETIFAYQ